MNWLAQAAEYLGGFPDDYLVVDVETAGQDPLDVRTLLIEFGYCLVQKRAVAHSGSFLLDWTDPELRIDQAWLYDTLKNTQRELSQNGYQSQFVTYEELQDQGAPVSDCLKEILGILESANREELPIVGHNFLSADAPVIQRHVYRYLGAPFRFQSWTVIDTGMLEKGRQMQIAVPDRNKSIEQFYNSIARRWSKARWNLSRACVEEYGLKLSDKDLTRVHRADFDCVLNHRLLEGMRSRAELQQV